MPKGIGQKADDLAKVAVALRPAGVSLAMPLHLLLRTLQVVLPAVGFHGSVLQAKGQEGRGAGIPPGN
jgi:hypothetical protein